MSALKYWLWLNNLEGLRNQTRLSLLQHFGSPENIYYADREEILLTEGITREQARLLEEKSLRGAEQALEDCRRLGIRILTIQDADYPSRLKNIYDPPCLLYVRGDLSALDEEVAIAVVGTRTSTPYGERAAEKLSGQLAGGGAVVVTGLARGIDTRAAQGALRCGGRVVGVLGNGLDVIYPPENRWLYEDVAASGALVSEYAPGTEPSSRHFPVRNRILSGLSVAALVVEAPERSGALITAATALEQGRDVYAVPGPIDAEMSRGCNQLIREGAGLCADGSDILRDYADRYPGKLQLTGTERIAPAVLGHQARETVREAARPVPPTLDLQKDGAGLTDDQICILRTLTEEPMQVDDLIEAAEIPVRRVLSALTMLEIDGYVAQTPGKYYARTVTLSK